MNDDIKFTKPVPPGWHFAEFEEPLDEEAGVVGVWFDGIPDAVRKPKELGGENRMVISHDRNFCPIEGCGTRPTNILHLLIEVNDEDALAVAGCPNHGWVWYSFPLQGGIETDPNEKSRHGHEESEN